MNKFAGKTFQGWRIWHPIASMFFVNGAIFGMWATQIPSFRDRLGLDPFILSVILLMLGGGTVLAMAVSAWLIELLGAVMLIRISASLYCGMGILIPLVPNTISLAIVVLMFGAAGGNMNVAMNTIASDVERHSGRHYMSSFHGMWSLGGFTGSGAGALLLRASSPATDALIISATMFVLFLVEQRGLFALRQKASTKNSYTSTQPKFKPAGPALIFGVIAVFAFAGEGVVLDWGAVYMKQTLGAGPGLALMGYVAFAGSMAIMRFAGDSIRQRFSGRSLVCVGALVAAAGLMAGPLSLDPTIMIVGCAVAGAGLANLVPVLFSLAGALPRPEVQIAAVSTMGFGGLLAVPPLLGLIGQHYGLAPILYAGATGDAAIAILAFYGITSSPAPRPAVSALPPD